MPCTKPSCTEIGAVNLVARQLARAAGERQAAFLEAVDAIGDFHRLDDVLLDEHDAGAFRLDFDQFVSDC